MKFELPKLEYAEDALAPHISEQTIAIHYHKHHQGYMDKLEKAIGGTKEADKSLEELIKTTEGNVFNSAAQVWNHSFYWKSMSPNGGGKPSGELAEAIDKDFGSLQKFNEEFSEAAKGEFGSGWAWLVSDKNGKLKVTSSDDAENPIQSDGKQVPLLTIDVWEHAYYLDYQNERGEYVKGFIKELINWDFAAENYSNL